MEVRSPHFTVTSDGSEKDARKVLLQFEQVRALLQEVWPGARVDTVRPVTILAVRDEGALRALLPEFWEKRGALHPAGVFVDAPDRGWVALRMDVARFREGDDTWDNPYLIVFHEYVHLVLRLNFESLPAWLDEGLAEFWGNTIIEGDRVYEGRHVPYHLQTLRQRTPMSLAALFGVAHGSPEYSEQDRATIFYAQSWALVHYLVLGSDERQGQLNRFAALLQAGKPAAVAAKEAFGDTEALDRELQAYVRRPVFRYRRRMARLEVKEEAWTARRLSEAESLALRAGLHVGRGGRPRPGISPAGRSPSTPARPRLTSRWPSSPGGRERGARRGMPSPAPRRSPARATTRTTCTATCCGRASRAPRVSRGSRPRSAGRPSSTRRSPGPTRAWPGRWRRAGRPSRRRFRSPCGPPGSSRARSTTASPRCGWPPRAAASGRPGRRPRRSSRGPRATTGRRSRRSSASSSNRRRPLAW